MSAAYARRHRSHHHAHPSGDLVPFFVVVGLLLVVARPAAAIVAFIWGLSIAGRFARRVVEPEIRRHYVERETERTLRREGYEVEQADAGGDAVARLAAEAFDLVLTDLALGPSPSARSVSTRSKASAARRATASPPASACSTS